MKKAILGVALGAVAYFAWGFVSWVILPWHNATVKSLPEETLITDTMKVVIKEPGFYAFPHNMNLPSQTQADGARAWEERFRRGPVGAVAFSPEGREPMAPSTYLKSFLSGLVIAGVVMLVLAAARDRFRSLVHRVHLAAAVGLAAGFASHVVHRVWFTFPIGYTVVNVLDLMVGFAILGAVMAKFVPEA